MNEVENTEKPKLIEFEKHWNYFRS